MIERASWGEYFMGIARQVATRATCPRKNVGAVLVRDRTILATGYNGSVRGAAHCTDVGCAIDGGHCNRTVHAEANAIAQAARIGTAIDGATLYTTASPCHRCYMLAVNAGCTAIRYDKAYGSMADVFLWNEIPVYRL